MLGRAVAGDRIDIVDRKQCTAAECADRGIDIRTQRRERQVLRAAPGCIRGGAGRDQEMRTSAAERTRKIQHSLRRLRSRAAQQIERNAVVARLERLESLMRRPAQRQRQLCAHEPSGGEAGCSTTTTAGSGALLSPGVSSAPTTTMTGSSDAR